MPTEFSPGTRVIVWGRPEPNLVLLFGEGHYEGSTYVNGNYWPTVRLTNGREVTIHQMGVSVGRAEDVAAVCGKFQGNVMEWDLDEYLKGHKPSSEQRTQRTAEPTPSGPPKTATDKVLLLRQEIAREEDRIKLAQDIIAKSNATIAAKRKEISDLTTAVLAELVAVNPDIVALIKEMPQQPTVATPTPTPQVAPIVKPIASTPAPTAPVPDDDDHVKLAVED